MNQFEIKTMVSEFKSQGLKKITTLNSTDDSYKAIILYEYEGEIYARTISFLESINNLSRARVSNVITSALNGIKEGIQIGNFDKNNENKVLTQAQKDRIIEFAVKQLRDLCLLLKAEAECNKIKSTNYRKYILNMIESNKGVKEIIIDLKKKYSLHTTSLLKEL